ncbi:ABC transporter permease [Actinoplanes sp. TBRC 11911]|uniref:FtsX-like permease family protein n=1 Tax=Actinoplanes sp. TBRC 11911 TaxID=2729386 RepID=UPI00145E5A6C|nr:FtsX-like permease family protein [Actinoplanes sp. TBRC 11911]NMO57371.1 ABC transporter permease [Actinoplanes sp. TBRC 11911]
MIALVLAMVWNRRGQAVTLALLSLFGVAAAVAAPAYLRAADRAVAAGQVEVSTAGERSVTLSTVAQPGADQVNLDSTGDALVALPGFDYVYATEFPVLGVRGTAISPDRFVYRQFACDHLRMTAGRCLLGEGDVVVGAATAKEQKLAPGDQVTVTFATFVSGPGGDYWKPDGTPKTLLVAGVYDVPQPNDVYWGSHGYFTLGAEPVFVANATFASTEHGRAGVTIDGYGSTSSLGVDKLPALRSGLTSLDEVAQLSGMQLTTSLPALLARIDSGRQAAHRIVPVIAVCLVLLSCLTIFLAVGYGTEGRRPELAVVALRGARFGQRWWLATGESVVAIVAGAIAGCLAAQLLVNVFAAWRFPHVGADAGLGSLRWAPVAAGAAVLTALVAQRKQVATPVAELLRRAPVVPNSAVAIAFEVVFVVFAGVAAVQLGIGRDLRGLGTFATALVLLALAMIVGRLLLPWAGPISRRALSRGRLALALAGFQLFRRPGAVRLFALLTAAVAVAGYASYAVDVGAAGRVEQSVLGTGAARVVTVSAVSRQGLLGAVRAVDPSGAYAMAAIRLPGTAGLAVDSTRLAAVAAWPSDGPSIASVAHALHPAPATGVLLPGPKALFDITTTGFAADKSVAATVFLSPVSGLADQIVPLGVLREGRHMYGRADVPECAKGCLVNAFEVSSDPTVTDVAGHIVVHSLSGVSLGALPWRTAAGGRVRSGPDGLQMDVVSLNGLRGMFAEPADVPLPVPVAAADRPSLLKMTGLDAVEMPVKVAARLPVVPGVGAPATLIDLDYADRMSTDGAQSEGAEVWLGPRSPADILDRLTAQRLVITGDTSAARVRQRLDDQGPALALWFYAMVAVLAVALAAGALILASAVDRARRVEDLTALRDQGLGRAVLRRATLWTYPVLVAMAVPAGVVIALLGWRITGWALPLAGIDPLPFPLSSWPRPSVVVVTAVAILLVLAFVAGLAGRRTLRLIR